MSVKDLNRKVIIYDCLDDQILATMDYDDKDDLKCNITCSVRTAKIVDIVLKCINNEHGCYIRTGFKPLA